MIIPRIDWREPIFPTFMLWAMFLAAYGGDLAMALYCLGMAWIDRYLTGEKKKALPRESYLVDPLPPIKPRTSHQ